MKPVEHFTSRGFPILGILSLLVLLAGCYLIPTLFPIKEPEGHSWGDIDAEWTGIMFVSGLSLCLAAAAVARRERWKVHLITFFLGSPLFVIGGLVLMIGGRSGNANWD